MYFCPERLTTLLLPASNPLSAGQLLPLAGLPIINPGGSSHMPKTRKTIWDSGIFEVHMVNMLSGNIPQQHLPILL